MAPNVINGLRSERDTSTVSIDTPSKKHSTPWHSDREIRKFLCVEVKKQRVRTDPAYVYVFKPEQDTAPPEGTGIAVFKVGSSVDPFYRMDQINWTCKANLKEVVNREQKRLLQAEIAEKLAQRELGPWKYDFDCKCKVKHREYFRVTEKKAVEVVQRWTAFCRRNPWDENGNLKAFWLARVDECLEKWKLEEHDLNDNRWQSFTQPDFWEKPLFDLCALFKLWIPLIFMNRWPLLYFCQGIRMMFDSDEVSQALKVWMAIGCLMMIIDGFRADSQRVTKFKRI